MPKWYIEANALMDYARNQKDKSIAPNDIARFPKADVQEVKHGKWIVSGMFDDFLKCSICGFEITMFNSFNYCPICGAKMDEKEEIDDTDSKASV